MLPQIDAPLQAYNTLALRSTAQALLTVRDERGVREALSWARAQGLDVIPLGQGSNVVLAGDLSALVLRQTARGVTLLEDRKDAVLLRVAAGQDWHALVEWSLAEGLYGLENLALIPGSVGAAPIQNIGAYGVELQSFVVAVHTLAVNDGKAVSLNRAECEFGYRDSIFKHRLRDQLVITAVDLRLSRRSDPCLSYPALAAHLDDSGGDRSDAQQIFRAVVNIRRSKLPDPRQLPNAGSFFKNPVIAAAQAMELQRQFAGLPVYPLQNGSAKLPAAWLIDKCGWKGHRAGGVGVHPEHALVLANYGADSGEQLLQMAAAIGSSVESRFGVTLAIEPRVYGAAT